MDEQTSAPKIVDHLITRAHLARASDVHLQMDEQGAEVKFRLDGVLTPVIRYPRELAERIFGRIKFLARLKTYQESFPQDGRINKEDTQTGSDIRVATYPTVTGEKIVLRLFLEETAKNLEELGLSPELVSLLQQVLAKTSGLVLLTGPAGSGKTTTIYACLRFLAQLGGRHIITVEDPVEQILPGIMQTEVNEPRGLTFAVAARHLLRQDPQVLVLGEIRDEETAHIAVRAASTGHLVITTLHAGSCHGVLERLMLLSRDLFAVSSSLELVLNQRLLRNLCDQCHGKKCEHCLGTGYRGRIPLVEFVHLNDRIRAEIRTSENKGLVPARTLTEHAQDLIAAGLTTPEEVQRVLGKT